MDIFWSFLYTELIPNLYQIYTKLKLKNINQLIYQIKFK